MSERTGPIVPVASARAERLPRPAWLLTFDDRQVVAAVDLGFGIVETTLSIPGRSTAHGLLVEPTSRP